MRVMTLVVGGLGCLVLLALLARSVWLQVVERQNHQHALETRIEEQRSYRGETSRARRTPDPGALEVTP